YTITAADLAACAAAYSAAVHEAPLTVGHPAGNRPAYGWVAGLQADGDVLKSSHRDVEVAFAEMVGQRRFPKRSASFYHPQDPCNPRPGVWYLRHVAYLGAQPPAIKGLKEIEFSEAAQAVNFSEPTEPTKEQEHQMDLQAQLDKAKAELEAEKAARAKADSDAAAANARATTAEGQVANFGEQAKAQRHAAHVSFAEAQVKAGKLLPKDQATTVAVLDQLAAGELVEFSEGNATKKVAPVEFVKGLIEGATPKVQFGEFAPGNAAGAEAAAQGDSDADIDRKARAYMVAHKVNYSEALTAVTATFTA
ncbi:MAG: hypothetical protein KF686_16090, partial [Ramlibacter sp.]|nr:hypothetical protein [Ramlibacter sp.]